MSSVQVAVRVRPLNEKEQVNPDCDCILSARDDELTVRVPHMNGAFTHKFAYDNTFWSADRSKTNKEVATQQTVFKAIGTRVVDCCFEGFNVCVFAYGQTGSGKSYTMFGNTGDQSAIGLIPRITHKIFNEIEAKKSSLLKFKVLASYMEIYNERVKCLLNPSMDGSSLKVREHPETGPYVENLTRMEVRSHQEVFHVMDDGNKLRTTAATNMNAHSSRSHAVFQLHVTQDIMMEDCDEVLSSKSARLNLVDLAGSERASKTHATGTRLQEGANINKSLTTLGQVISALADIAATGERDGVRKKHIPYRDSVLTYLLKDNLGGNSKTIMIATVSAASDNYEETMSTLRYAERAKKIMNKAVVNEDQNSALVASLQCEIQKLQAQLHQQDDAASKAELEANEALMQQLQVSWEEKIQHAHEVARLRGEEVDAVLRRKEELETEVEGLMLQHTKQQQEMSNLQKRLDERDTQVENVLRMMREKEKEFTQKVAALTASASAAPPATDAAQQEQRRDEKAEVHLLRQQMAVMAQQIDHHKRIEERKQRAQGAVDEGLNHKIQALLHTLNIEQISDEERVLMSNLHVKDMAMVYDQLSEGADTADVWSNLMVRLEGKSDGFKRVTMDSPIDSGDDSSAPANAAALFPSAVGGPDDDEEELQSFSPTTKAGLKGAAGASSSGAASAFEAASIAASASSASKKHRDPASPGRGKKGAAAAAAAADGSAMMLSFGDDEHDGDLLDDLLGDDSDGGGGGGEPDEEAAAATERANALLDEILGGSTSGGGAAAAATEAKTKAKADGSAEDLLNELLSDSGDDSSSSSSSSGSSSSSSDSSSGSDALEGLLDSSTEESSGAESDDEDGDGSGKDLLDELLDDADEGEKKKKKKKRKPKALKEHEGILMDGDGDEEDASSDDALLDELLGDGLEASGGAGAAQEEEWATGIDTDGNRTAEACQIGQQNDSLDEVRTKVWNVLLFNCSKQLIEKGDAPVEALLEKVLKDPGHLEKFAKDVNGDIPTTPDGDSDHVTRLRNFYCFYNKSRLPQIESIVKKVAEKGKDALIMDTACKKYAGSEPVLLSAPPRRGVEDLKNSHWFWGPILSGRGPPAYIPEEEDVDSHPLKDSPPPKQSTRQATEAEDHWRPRLQRFFEHHSQKRSPENIKQLLTNFQGIENQMMQALVQRYGPEPGAAAVSQPRDRRSQPAAGGRRESSTAPKEGEKSESGVDTYGSTNNPMRVDVNSVSGHGALLSGFSVLKLNPKYGKMKDKLSKQRVWVIDFYKRTFTNLSDGRPTQVYPSNYLFRIEKMFHDYKQLKLSFYKAPHPYILEFSSAEARQRFYELAWAMRRHICWMPDLVPKTHHSIAVNILGKSRRHKNINGVANFHLTREPTEMLTVWCGTLSLANVNLPPPGTPGNQNLLTGFLPRPSKFDLHFICMTDLPELFSQNPLELVKYFKAYSSETDLHPFLSTNLGGSTAVVLALAKRRHISKVGNMEAIELRDNNTLVVGLSLRYGESTIALVRARLSESMPVVKKNQKIATIMRKLEIGDCRLEFSSRYDYVVMVGDLGYKGTPQEADDELTAEIAKGSVMTGYQEPEFSKNASFVHSSVRVFVKTQKPNSHHPISYTTCPQFTGGTTFAAGLAMQRPYLGSFVKEANRRPTQLYFTDLSLKIPHKEIVRFLGVNVELAIMSQYMEGSPVMVKMLYNSKAEEYQMARPEDVPPVHMVTSAEDFLRRQSMTFSIVSGQTPPGDFPYASWSTGVLSLKHYSALETQNHFQCSVYRTGLKVGTMSGQTIRLNRGTALQVGLKRSRDEQLAKQNATPNVVPMAS